MINNNGRVLKKMNPTMPSRSKNEIKKYFMNKERLDGERHISDNKRSSASSGVAITTNTSIKQFKNVSSVGSMSNIRDGRNNLFQSKNTDSSSNPPK